MLQIKDIRKKYVTGPLVQKALDGVSLAFRDSEFVAILGPSGSGKTTLLNIIGGLDRYDSGDLIINGISTKKYKDRDWDSYRNHTIGFVFQSYNLIPHQTVLANVELALTISGVSKKERRQRAVRALEQVGLGNQLHKRPNQMSGGQMQRVAIARALVNDPDILLADEPTGALDSDTSVQVMELLKEVAATRLVIMVTHNPELAQEYASRIVTLRDGLIQTDSDPFQPSVQAPAVHKNMGRSSMSLLTALSLSFNNLRTKKARTLLTSFAGSIGIIGIALILSLSNGVNQYIQSVEEETLSEYPLQIQSTGLDLTSMMVTAASGHDSSSSDQVTVNQSVAAMFSGFSSNDLASFKAFLDSGESGIQRYVSAVEYTYNVSPQIWRIEEDEARQVHPDTSFSAMGLGSAGSSNSLMSMATSTDVFYQMPRSTSLFEEQYEVKAGRWPQSWNECVVVLTAGGSINDQLLYTLGLRDSDELEEMIRQFLAEENVDVPTDDRQYTYNDFLGVEFRLVNAADYYTYDEEYQVWTDHSQDAAYMLDLAQKGEPLTVVGVVQPAEGASATALRSGIAYPAALTERVIDQAAASEIVSRQLEQPGVDVFSGDEFGTKKETEFDMGSLFTVDEKALQKAFAVDESKLTAGLGDSLQLDLTGIDLSGMIDPDAMASQLPELPAPDLAAILSQLDLQISPEGISTSLEKLLTGYGDYAASHPEADYSQLGQQFMDYLETDDAQQRLADALEALLEESGQLELPAEKLQQLIVEILEGYPEFAEQNGYTDPDKFSEYLALYLQTPEVQQQLELARTQLLELAEGALDLTADQAAVLAQSLLEGYQQYAAANGLPDPARMGEHFLAYLQTPEATQMLLEGLQATINMEALEQQLGTIMQGYMQSTVTAVGQAIQSQLTGAMKQAAGQIASAIEKSMVSAMSQMGKNFQNAFQIDTDAFSAAIQVNMDADQMQEVLLSMFSAQDATYEGNLKKLGYADLAEPSGINIYPLDFESKEKVLDILDGYNQRMEDSGQEEKVIRYTDVVGTLMTSVTDIINVISYVLVAFVAISLVVSSIMIGVITYISVLERKKEIGILRAIGASKRNVSQVFNAETFIIGLCAGVIGIGITLLALIPANQFIHYLAGSSEINAILPAGAAVALILLSVLLTLLGGLIPSRKAAKSDPVTALRTE